MTVQTPTDYAPAMAEVETERWVTRDEAADVLRVSKGLVDKLVRDKKLPRYRVVGVRAPRFRIEDVRALITGPDNPTEEDQ
jgi:excisionase family DNA binding protein